MKNRIQQHPLLVKSCLGSAALAFLTGAPTSHAQSSCQIGDDLCIVHPGFVVWYVDSNKNLFGWENHGAQLGLDSDKPNFVAGEPFIAWGNARDDFFIFRNGQWFGRSNVGTTNAGPIELVGNFGLAGDLAMIGNFQNSGDQLAVVGRRGSDLWLFVDSNRNMQYDLTIDRGQRWNIPLASGDRVLAGYFGDNNGEDIAVCRPGASVWSWEFYLQMPFEGVAGTPFAAISYGSAGEMPLTMDVNGDGKSDVLMWNPQFNRVFINLWEQGAPNSGYGPDHDVDAVCDMAEEVNYVNDVFGTPGLPWDTAALGLNFDSNQIIVPPAPTSALWEDQRVLCDSGGGTIRLSTQAVGTYRYVWTRDSCAGPIVGEGPTVTLPAPMQTTTYFVHAENRGPCARASACASVTVPVFTAPVILQNPGPSPQIVCPGDNAELSIIVQSDLPVTYRWRRFGVEIFDGVYCQENGEQSAFSGTGTSTLTLLKAMNCSVGAFDCIVSNACGAVITPGTGSIGLCAADFNCDDFLNGDDFDEYVAAFEIGDPRADCNRDGFVTGDDFDWFVTLFEAGC